MLRSQEALVTAAAAQAAELEKSVMGIDPVQAEAVLGDLFALRHDLQTIRTNAAQTHELYVHLIDVLGSQEELMALDVRRLNDLRLGFSHLRNTADLEREYLQEVLDLLQTRVSTELNRFVRKITAWGTIGIAWTVIVGIYGMNFEDIPGSDGGSATSSPSASWRCWGSSWPSCSDDADGSDQSTGRGGGSTRPPKSGPLAQLR